MSQTTIYQTLESKNLLTIIDRGPYRCNWKNAWLGDGFYFWDSHIELAHWWGRIRYIEKGKRYVITSAVIILDDKCWDLHGKGSNRIEFLSTISELRDLKLFNDKKTSVSHVIEFLKKRAFFNKYESIRILGSNSVKEGKLFKTNRMWKMFFEDNLPGYYELYPPVQICLFSKKSHNFTNYHIVYPEKVNLQKPIEEDYLG